MRVSFGRGSARTAASFKIESLLRSQIGRDLRDLITTLRLVYQIQLAIHYPRATAMQRDHSHGSGTSSMRVQLFGKVD